MSEPNKLCPFISTAQILVTEIVFRGESEAQRGISLSGIQGHGAKTPDRTTSAGKAVFVHKDPVLPEGHDPSRPVDVQQISRYRGQPISVPCVRDQCQGWDPEAMDCGYKPNNTLLAGLLAGQEVLLSQATKEEA